MCDRCVYSSTLGGVRIGEQGGRQERHTKHADGCRQTEMDFSQVLFFPVSRLALLAYRMVPAAESSLVCASLMVPCSEYVARHPCT